MDVYDRATWRRMSHKSGNKMKEKKKLFILGLGIGLEFMFGYDLV